MMSTSDKANARRYEQALEPLLLRARGVFDVSATNLLCFVAALMRAEQRLDDFRIVGAACI